MLDYWRTLTARVWRPPFRLLDIDLHPDFGLAFTLAFFFLTMGVGAAVSARLQGTSEPRPRFADMMRIGGYLSKTDSWAFMLICLAIMLSFFIGDERPAGTPKLSRNVDFLVVWIIAFGAMLGLYVGQYAYFYRVRRLAITVIAILGVSLAMTHWPIGSAGASVPGTSGGSVGRHIPISGSAASPNYSSRLSETVVVWLCLDVGGLILFRADAPPQEWAFKAANGRAIGLSVARPCTLSALNGFDQNCLQERPASGEAQ